jgi:Domain of unknown function (DUF4365)
MAALFARIGDLCDIPVVTGASLGSRTRMAKSISRQQSIGERGRHLFSERVLAAGLSFHPTGPLDAGIDGFIELRDPRTGEVRAQYVMAQLKTREDGAFSQETESSFSWTVDQRDLEYWLGSNAPVILVVVRLSDRLMVWKSIRDYFATSEKKASRKIFFDKTEDALITSSAPALATLVASFGRPGAMVPAMRAEEQLDTNLLRAVFQSTVNIAPTDLTYAEIRQATLQVEDPAPIDWILYGKRIITFRDTESALFQDIVEPGTADNLPTLTWASSDGEVTRREFVDLLQRCLSQRMRGRLFFHHQKRLLVFPRGRSIERKITYQSYKRRPVRHVVKAGGKKLDGSGPAYYRHAAFAPRFVELQGQWYLAIEPTYHFTSNGYEEYPFESERLAGIKRLETNQTVRSHIGMWRAILTEGGDLLRTDYPYLRFEMIPGLPFPFGVPDASWRKGEDDEVTARFDEARRDLFD